MKRSIPVDFIGQRGTASENLTEKDTAEAAENMKNVGWMIGRKRESTEKGETRTETDGVVPTGNKPCPVSEGDQTIN